MKKLFTLKVVMMMLLIVAGFTKASAGADWIGNSYIQVDGVWYQCSGSGSWATGGAFNDHNFGEVSSLRIGAQIQVHAADNANWGSGVLNMNYNIDNDDNGWNSIELSYNTHGGDYGNNMMYQSGGTGDFVTTTINISSLGLSAGEHKLRIYFGPVDGCYDSNNSSNYVATFYIPESVTVTAAGYATYVSSNALDYTSTAIKAYTAKVNTANGKVVLSQIDKVPANTPVVLYKEGGITENIPIATSTDTPAASDLKIGSGVGVDYDNHDGKNYNYILNNVDNKIGFYKAAGWTVATNRAYLQTTYNVEGAGARMMMVFADDVTGIETVKGSESVNDYYNLAGQRVAQPTKGLYIVNGKKVIKK